MSVDVARLRTTLGTPELQWLINRLRERLERGDGLSGRVILQRASAEQRAAVDRLMGRPPTDGNSVAVDLARLQQIVVHARLASNLSEAVVHLTGPVTNVRAAEHQAALAWAAIFVLAETRLCDRPLLVRWIHELRDCGLLRRLAGADVAKAEELLEAAIHVTTGLPASAVPLAELAVSMTGDSHGLDPGRPLATLAVRAAAALGGQSDPTEALESTTGGAQAFRDAWGSVGVMCDELSAPVLTLNLRGDTESLTGQCLSLHARVGEPCRLSVRQLLRHPPTLSPEIVGKTVYVCENPTVVAAAANRLGTLGAALVCTDGQPSTAVRLLLNRLREAGVQLRYHGDFDWGGIRIANLVMRRHAAAPWRMSVADYRMAVATGGTAMSGPTVIARWDAELSPAMAEARRAVHEEQVLDALLCDLSEDAQRP